MAKSGIRQEIPQNKFRIGCEFLVKDGIIRYFEVQPHHAKTEMLPIMVK